MPRMPNQPIRPRCGAEVDEPIRPTATETGRMTSSSAATKPHEARRHSTAQSSMPTAITATTSPMRSICSLKREHRVRHERRRVLRIGRDLLGMRCVGIGMRHGGDVGRASAPRCALAASVDRRAAGALRRRLLLQPAQGDAGGEHGEEAVAVRQAGDAVGQADQAEGEEVVEADRFLVGAAQVEHELADRGAEDGADADAGGHRPEHVDREPAPAEAADVVQPEQAEAEQHERKGGAVVEAGLAGEGEAEPVAVARLGDLHVGGEHRVGRREDAAEQDRGAERQAEREHADAGDQRHRHQHRQDRQAQRQQPAAVAAGRRSSSAPSRTATAGRRSRPAARAPWSACRRRARSSRARAG